MRLSDFDDWARAHHGIITFEASGLSRASWYRAIHDGDLHQLHPLVARLIGTPDTPEQRIVAGVLAIGEPALASHRSAARLWGVPRPDDDPVDVILTGERRDLRLDGVVIHRPTDRERLAPQRQYGISCTNILRTLIDLGAVDPGGVHTAVGHAVATRLASLEAIEAAAGQHARQRPAAASCPFAMQSPTGRSTRSRPTRSSRSSCAASSSASISPPSSSIPSIEGYEVDFRVVDAPVIIECDGWAYHGAIRDNFERDHERDARLTGAGWIVLRFTYRAITTRPKATADRIREAVERWAPTGRRLVTIPTRRRLSTPAGLTMQFCAE